MSLPPEILGPGIGYTLSVILFIIDQIRGSKATQEITKQLKDDKVIRDYLEWLRRQDQETLLQTIDFSKDQLLQELGNLGADIQGFADRILESVHATEQELLEQLKELNGKLTAPVLSPVPLQTRAIVNIPLVARDEDLRWLQASSDDCIIYGQPGSGKTYLLYHYLQSDDGRFLITQDPDIAADAVINGCPPVIVIDDAADQIEAIQRLLHVRDTTNLDFRIVAICWPFEWETIAQTMRLSSDRVHELSLLPRKVIAELIQSVLEDAGYHAPHSIVRELNNQSTGRPGLAVALTQSSLTEDFQAVMRGDKISQLMGSLYDTLVGPAATHILAAFSVGGDQGMEMSDVSDCLNIPIIELHQALKTMAPGGVIELWSKTKFVVRPRALRRSLLKRVFFNEGEICLPQNIYESLLEKAPNYDTALVTLISAAHIDADIDATWLKSLMVSAASSDTFDAYAALGKAECVHVLDEYPKQIDSVIDSCLHYIPDQIIPIMLNTAVTDERPLNSHPEAPLRKLNDWVSHAKTGTPDALERRKVLFESVEIWLSTGGDVYAALKALKAVFGLGYEGSETDPGDGMTITFSSGLLIYDEMEKLAELWPPFLELLRKYGIPDWKPVTNILSEWMHPRSRMGRTPEEGYYSNTRAILSDVVKELIAIASGHNGFLRWVYSNRKALGIAIDAIPVSPEYLTLFPVERLSKDYKKEEARYDANAKSLVDAWKDLPLTDIIERIQLYEQQASEMSHSWPRLTPRVCCLIAEQRELSLDDLAKIFEASLSADLLDTFIYSAIQGELDVTDVIRKCIGTEEYRHLAIYHTLRGGIQDLYDEIKKYLGQFARHIELLGHGPSVPESIISSLLNHTEPAVRLSAALAEIRCDPKGSVRENLFEDWRNAIIEGIAEYSKARDLSHIYDLKHIVAYDRTLAFDIMMCMSQKDALSAVWDIKPIAPLLEALNKDERCKLLDACEPLFMTDLVKYLIADDLEMYATFIARPEMKRHHLVPLAGSPKTDEWACKALIAYEAGYKPMDISLAARGSHWGGMGPMSNMWQEWVDEFSALLEQEDSRVKEIAEAGIEWSSAERDRALQEEKHESIYGRFNDQR